MRLCRMLLCLCLLMAASACNLAATQPKIITISSSTPVPAAPATRTARPTALPTASATPSPSGNADAASIEAKRSICAQPSDWTTYIVDVGDTLYSIARRSNTDVDTLADVNCLADASRIDVGEILYVPFDLSPTETADMLRSSSAPAPLEGSLELWWLLPDDAGVSGPLAGCGDSLIPAPSGIPTDLDAADRLNNALAFLTDPAHGESTNGGMNLMAQTELTAVSYRIENSHVIMNLEGRLNLDSDCFNARLESQLAMNILSLTDTETATILVNGENLRQAADLSGRESRTTYSRAGMQSGDKKTIQFWVGDESDYQGAGFKVGCDSYLLPVDTGILRSDDAIKDLRLALAALFSPDQTHPVVENFFDWVKKLGLVVEDISIQDGEARVLLAGGLMGIGTCGDAVLEAQIIQTVFQFETIERVMVTDGAMNLLEITDMSDLRSQEERANYVYTRPEN